MANCSSCGGTTVFISESIVKCEYCGKLYSVANGELNEVEVEKLYSNAVSMSKSGNEDDLMSAIDTFEALGSYKDSSALANTCRKNIEQSRMNAEEQRLEAERQAELDRINSEKRVFKIKQKAKIIGIIFALASVAVITVIVGQTISKKNKISSYNEAMELYNIGKYEDSLEVFNRLGNYSDATKYASTIEAILAERESKYEKGIGYYERGAYGECIASLTDISDYLDSTDYIEKSAEAIYQQATEHNNAGEFGKAKELLVKIPESSSKHMDAELLLTNVEEAIIEQTNAANYEQAKKYYENGDYETAQKLFINLGNYNDSATYLSSIGTHYYEQAKSLYNQQEYIQCGDILQNINSSEEWDEYSKATELFDNAAEVYIEGVKNEAKDICRSEGLSSMKSFIDDKVCVLLTNEDASVLKQECTINQISLENLKPYYSGSFGLGIEHSISDTLGNSYAFAFSGYMDVEDGGAYEVYNIDGQYKYFLATVSVQKQYNSINENCVGRIRIYGDDILIWSDDRIKSSTKPYDIKVDVDGVVDLKIEMYGDGNLGSHGITVLLGNPTLSE